MDNTVTVEVTSAFLVEGEVVLPGQTVEVLRTEAMALVARGKAVVVDADEAAAEKGGEVDEEGTPVLNEVLPEVAGDVTGGVTEDVGAVAASESAGEEAAPSAGRGRRKRG